MITRSELVELLRDYQIRPQRSCPALAPFSPKPHINTRADVAVAIFWSVVFSMLVGLTYLMFRYGHFWLSFLTACSESFYFCASENLGMRWPEKKEP